MPRQKKRGPVRDSKRGLSTKAPSKKVTIELLTKAVRYLEEELDMMTSMPGNAKEVLIIAKGLEAIRASQSGAPASQEVRAEFDLEGNV